MRMAKNPAVGQVIMVPVDHYAPWRHGWNGWDFSKGIVVAVGQSKNSGEKRKLYKVEYPMRTYGKGNKATDTKWFDSHAVFEADLWKQEQELKHSREELENGSYSAETEYLIDKGIVLITVKHC